MQTQPGEFKNLQASYKNVKRYMYINKSTTHVNGQVNGSTQVLTYFIIKHAVSPNIQGICVIR